jgi:glycosyltransferase involved in cell wall biosynthesis
LKLGFVVQRYGLDIAGGAEYHCRLVAEHLARHAEVDVLTTCASDYVTWENHYPEGTQTLNGVPVQRFAVERPREIYRFAEWSRRIEGPHVEADELRWLEEEGPLSPRLVAEVERRRSAYDLLLFFSYRYYTTYHGLLAAPERAVLVPTAENDGIYRLSIFQAFFRMPRAIVWNSPEERDMIREATGNEAVPGEVVGVGSELPNRLDPDAFRRRRAIQGPFLLYIGRIDLNKGCDELFEFFQRYRDETGSALRLLLMGKAVLEIPDDPAIVHLGFVSDQEKWDALAAAEALVIPSRYESLSMVTLEAWWARTPVLANARCEVLLGQCRRSNGGLYFAHYDEFREALATLEADAGLRRTLGENGRRYFDANYTWEIVERKYLDLLERLRAEDAGRARAS